MTGMKTAAICLSEIKLGIVLPLPYLKVAKAKLNASLVTMMMLGKTYSQSEALQAGLIQSVYESEADLDRQVKAFGKSVAFAGAESRALVMNKLNEYGDVVTLCREWTWSPTEDESRRKEYVRLNAYMKRLAQLKVGAKAKKAARPKL